MPKSGALFQLITQCNAKYVACFSAQKECNKEKNRNSSVVPGKNQLSRSHAQGARSSEIHCTCGVSTQYFSKFNLGSLRQIDRVGVGTSMSRDLSYMKPGFDLPQNATVFQLLK